MTPGTSQEKTSKHLDTCEWMHMDGFVIEKRDYLLECV